MPSIDIFVEMANYFVILTNFNKSGLCFVAPF